jgi:DNA-binding beta-propeller fold protein YncE
MRLAPDGSISTFAGNGDECQVTAGCGDGGPATSAELNAPSALARDAAGNLYIADAGDNEVRMVSPAGVISTFAGTGSPCRTAPSCGDGGPARAAQLNRPSGLAVDAAGNVYIADGGDNEIRVVDGGGQIRRLAGTGVACGTPGACGDGGDARSAQLNWPQGLALDAHGDLLVADTLDNEVRSISPGGTISRFAGNGSSCATAPDCGDGGPAADATLFSPEGVAVAGDGSVYIADYADSEVRLVSPGGTIARFAGNGSSCTTAPDCGDGERATDAQLNGPADVVLDSAGRALIADSEDQEVRAVAYGPVQPPPPPAPPLPVLSRLEVRPKIMHLTGVRRHGRCVAWHGRRHRHGKRRRNRQTCRRPVKLRISFTLNRGYQVQLWVRRDLPVHGYCLPPAHRSGSCVIIDAETVAGAPGANATTWKLPRRPHPGRYVVTAEVTAEVPGHGIDNPVLYRSSQTASFRIKRR